MDVEVFVHGVPHGEDFYGKEEERQFLSKFYNGCSDRLKFVVQSRNLGGKPYTYYSYIVGKDVKDADGRSGSYFGLTIRLDVYYGDFMSLFNILDSVFRNKILGVVLEKNANGHQYKVSKFGDVKISETTDLVIKLIPDLLKKVEISALKKVGVAKSNYAFNIYDASATEVEKAVLGGSVLSLSPYFTSKAIKQLRSEYEEKIQGLESNLSSIAKEKETQNKKNIHQLNNKHKQEMDESEREKDVYKKRVTTLNNQVNRLERDKKSLQELLAQYTTLFQRINDVIKNSGEKNKGEDDNNNQGNKSSKVIKNSGEDNKEEDDNNNQGNKPSRGKVVLRIAKFFQPFFVLLCLLMLSYLCINRETNQLSKQNNPNQENEESSDTSFSQPVSPEFKVYQFDKETKTPKGQPVDAVKRNTWYIATVIDSTGQDTCRWVLEGATAGETRKNSRFTFSATAADIVRIACVSSNGLGYNKELPVEK